MSFKERIFLSLENNFKYFENRPHIAVGVSGGPDSTALVYLLSKWIKFKNGKITALIFNHGIRSESKEESFQVKNMIRDFNLEVKIIKPNKKRLIKKNMANARENRFEGMINYCIKKNIFHLFLGHHFDDNLETYLIRKINGSNLEGLGSMNEITCFKNIQIVRPFINMSKSSILNYNKNNKLIFINDPTNKDINFTRVKVRKFLLNKNYQLQVKNDFLSLKKQIPNYKTMVWELLILCLINVSPNKITLNLNKLIKLDELIIEKHVMCLMKFLSKKNTQTKSSKIMIFIKALKKPSFKIFNLSDVIIQKSTDFLIFSQK